jgi:hypothetical protein
MAHYKTILRQIIAFIPRHDFDYHANIHYNGQKFLAYNRWSQFRAMMIDQLTTSLFTKPEEFHMFDEFLFT